MTPGHESIPFFVTGVARAWWPGVTSSEPAARAGERVVLTERGLPVARLVAVDAEGLLERLEREGVLTRPTSVTRPRASQGGRVPAKGSVSDLVAESRLSR